MTRKYEFVNELKFKVNSETELLQFTITGNISWLMLQIPLGKYRYYNYYLFYNLQIALACLRTLFI